MSEYERATAPTAGANDDWAASRGDRWRAQVAGLEAMLAPVDEPLIHALRLDRPYRIADVGCGGGGTTREVLRRAPQGSVVHGFDISPSLIESARARPSEAEPAITFEISDVSQASPPHGPYERLLSRFGIMFYADPPAAFANLARWLEPGGRFAFAVWGPPSDNPWFSTVREVAAEVAVLPTPEPNAPGPLRYAEFAQLRPLLEQAGLVELEVRDWRELLQIGGGLPAAEAARFALSAFSIGELVAQAGPHALERATQLLTDRYARDEEGGTVRLGASVRIVTGALPKSA